MSMFDNLAIFNFRILVVLCPLELVNCAAAFFKSWAGVHSNRTPNSRNKNQVSINSHIIEAEAEVRVRSIEIKMFVKLFLAAALAVSVVNGHGFLKSPLARTSIQTRDDLLESIPNWWEREWWWDHQGVWCGNVLQDTQYSACGRCGDTAGQTGANQNGIYDTKLITGTYAAGQVVEIEAEFGANHYGHFYVELCPQAQETDGCFQRLPVVSADREVRDGNRVCVTGGEGDLPATVKAHVWLPAGTRCERCTLRWTYRTSYPGHCSDPARDWCDNPCPTQTFRNCADIKIQ